MNKLQSTKMIMLFVFSCMLGWSVQGAVTPKVYFKMLDGNQYQSGDWPPNPYTAEIGNATLYKWKVGYSFELSADVPTNTTSGSTLSLDFGVNNPLADIYAGVVFTSGVYQTDNFVFEGWFKAVDTTGSKNLAYFGDHYASNNNQIGPYGPHGFGFYQIGDKYYAAFGGIGFRVMCAAIPGQWTHLAIVRDSATFTGDSQGVRLYVNGVQVPMAPLGAAPYGPYPTTHATIFSMGGTLDYDGELGELTVERNNGKVDDVRFSTFTSGSFQVSDLLTTVGTVPSYFTPLIYFMMQDQTGSAGNAPSNPYASEIGGRALYKWLNPGSFRLSSDVPSNTTSGSVLSIDFGQNNSWGDVYAGTVASWNFQADAFIFEGWFKAADVVGSKNLAYFGDHYASNNNLIGPYGPHGLGFYQIGDKYYAAFGGIGFREMAPAEPGVWTHLAIVRDSWAFTGDSRGVRLYVNGVQVPMAPLGAAPYAPSAHATIFSMGGTLNYDGELGELTVERNNGKIDDLRYSMFTPGSFNSSQLLLGSPSALNPTWNVNDNGNWHTSSNWLGGVPNASGAVANLLGVITKPVTITNNNAATTVGTLNFANFHQYTISGSGALTLANGSNKPVVNCLSGKHDIAQNLKGTNGFVKKGGGWLTLSNRWNDIYGTYIIQAGTLEIRWPESVGPNMDDPNPQPCSIIVENGGQLAFGVPQVIDYPPLCSIVLNGSGPNGSGALTYSESQQQPIGWQNITIATDSVINVHGASSDPAYANSRAMCLGDIRGSGNLTKIGNGWLDFEIPNPSGVEPFNGAITIQQGYFSIRHYPNSLGNAKSLTVSNAEFLLLYDQWNILDSIVYNPTPLILNYAYWHLYNTSGRTQSPVWTGTVEIKPLGATVWVHNAADTLNVSGQISGTGPLTIVGSGSAGTFNLTANNAGYFGQVNISVGTLKLSGAGTLRNSPKITVGGSGTLHIANTANTLSDVADVVVASGGKIYLASGVNEKVATLTLNGVAQPAGTYGSTSSGATYKNDTYFSGTGILTVTSSTQTRLSGTVQLGNWLPTDLSGMPVTVRFKNGSTVTTVETVLNSTGGFTVGTPGPATYEVAIKASHWLTKKHSNVAIVAGDNTDSVAYILANGDCNDDNAVNLKDFAVIAKNWLGEEFDIVADLNGDDEVNDVDLAILAGNWLLSGDTI